MTEKQFPQSPPARRLRSAVLTTLALLFFVTLAAACGDSSGESSNGDDDGGPIEVSFVDGQISGGTLRTVDLGAEVDITVTADVEDEVHVHGYDLFESVADGSPASFTFTADIPGDFEIELEDSGRLLFNLRVK